MFTIHEHEAYCEVSFHAPASANALSRAAALELRALGKKLKNGRKPIVVRSGHPRVFCSGGNLKDYAKLKSKAAGLKVNRDIAACLDDFAQWKAVKIAVIEGDVFGGGMEWLARFDFRWCTPEAILAFWQRRIGLSPGWGGGAYWAEKIGEDRLRRLLLAAEPLSAPAALRAGLVDRIHPQWQMQEEVERFARDLQGDAVHAARSWSRKKESQIFSGLWMNAEHAAILKRWK